MHGMIELNAAVIPHAHERVGCELRMIRRHSRAFGKTPDATRTTQPHERHHEATLLDQLAPRRVLQLSLVAGAVNTKRHGELSLSVMNGKS